jgi:predicted Co/Zn/Cd cation transporter (cation efflux family)
MNATTLTHPMTTLAARTAPPRRTLRTSLLGAVVLALAWGLLAGSFLFDVARPPL